MAKIINGVETYSVQRIPWTAQLYRWYTVRVVVQGYRIRAFLDNLLVFDYVATDMPGQGRIGLRTWYTPAQFANVTVKAIHTALLQSNPAENPPPGLNSGWVAYYPFDGNANDASGNGHDATLMNSPSFVNGVRGSAVYLKGSGEFGTDGQYVQLSFIRLADYPAFTVALWAKLDGVTAGDCASLISLGTETCGPPKYRQTSH